MNVFTSRGTEAARIAFLIASAISAASGQMPGGSPGSATPRPLPIPQTGRANAAGTAAAPQSTAPAGVDTIATSIQVSGNLQGSVPSASRQPGELALTLGDAVRRGLEANLGAVSAANSVTAAGAQRIQALSALLPNLSVSAAETENQVNLAAYGFKFNLPPGLDFSIPSVVGPFSYSQLQGNLSQAIYDPVARRNWQATRELEHASTLSAKDARELVVLAVAGTYLQTIATSARIVSQRAQVADAQAVYDQAQIRKAAGTNARIDVTRTLVELQSQQQRLNALGADFRKQKITLARLIGLPLDQEFSLSEPLSPTPVPVPDIAAAIRQATRNRADLQAAEAQVRAAERVVAAAHAERLPSVSVGGDYGVLGPNPAQTHGVFAVVGSVNLPIWLGGRIRGDIQQAEAALHQRQAELADQRARVEQEVRTASIELETALGQVHLAETNRTYAAETLREARDRFNLGVGTTVEIVQAEEQVAGAESDYVSSLFSLDVARLSLSRAMGEAETALPNLLQGSRP